MNKPTCDCKEKGKPTPFGHRSTCPVIVSQWRALVAQKPTDTAQGAPNA